LAAILNRRGGLTITPYKNFAGNSGVVANELAADSITVQFVDGEKYRYSYASDGPHNVEQMKVLAKAGRGLATFINKLKPPYSARQ
jgi:hypothetical protein